MKEPQKRVNPYDQRVKDFYTSKTFRNYIIGTIVFVCLLCACVCVLPPVTSRIISVFGPLLERLIFGY